MIPSRLSIGRRLRRWTQIREMELVRRVLVTRVEPASRACWSRRGQNAHGSVETLIAPGAHLPICVHLRNRGATSSSRCYVVAPMDRPQRRSSSSAAARERSAVAGDASRAGASLTVVAVLVRDSRAWCRVCCHSVSASADRRCGLWPARRRRPSIAPSGRAAAAPAPSRRRPTLSYDLLSFDIGSRPAAGDRAAGSPVSCWPIEVTRRDRRRWPSAGGSAGGHRRRRRRRRRDRFRSGDPAAPRRGGDHLRCGPSGGAGRHCASAAVLRAFEQHHIRFLGAVSGARRVVRRTPGRRSHPAGVVDRLGDGGGGAIFARSGLPVDERGFLRVGDDLRCAEYPEIFAAAIAPPSPRIPVASPASPPCARGGADAQPAPPRRPPSVFRRSEIPDPAQHQRRPRRSRPRLAALRSPRLAVED